MHKIFYYENVMNLNLRQLKREYIGSQDKRDVFKPLFAPNNLFSVK